MLSFALSEITRLASIPLSFTENRCTDSKVSELLFGSPLPSDFGFWCLEQAEATTDRRMAREYLRHARDHGVPLDTLLDRTGDHEILCDEMRKVLVCRILPNYFDDSVAGRGFLNRSSRGLI